MFTRPLSRIAAVSARKFHCGLSRVHVPPFSHVVGMAPVQQLKERLQGVGCAGGTATALGTVPQAWSGGCRQFTVARKRGPRKNVKFTREELEGELLAMPALCIQFLAYN